MPTSLPGPAVFFGTPEFAVPTLDALLAAGLPIGLVVTQPDRPAGRGGRRRPPPVALRALRLGLELAQPRRVRAGSFLDRLAELEPALAVVVAFGQVFPGRLLRLPPLGCINLHASLLPRWRGASPIVAAIAAGDRVTGVTTMVMEKELDTGPILLQREIAIGARETAAELSARLARAGAELTVETVRRLAAGRLEPRPQRTSLVTYAPLLERADGRVDWRADARTQFNRLRAFTPWPGLHAELAGRPVKLLEAEPVPGDTTVAPGVVAGMRSGLLVVGCGGGSLLGIARLQRPGGRPLAAADFVNGERLRPGDRFA
jgi:methionyl-tRNA formyltransferase